LNSLAAAAAATIEGEKKTAIAFSTAATLLMDACDVDDSRRVEWMDGWMELHCTPFFHRGFFFFSFTSSRVLLRYTRGTVEPTVLLVIKLPF